MQAACGRGGHHHVKAALAFAGDGLVVDSFIDDDEITAFVHSGFIHECAVKNEGEFHAALRRAGGFDAAFGL